MADTNVTTYTPEDMLPVRSRVSWGALLSGIFVTFAVMVLLSALGTAIGLSAADGINRRDLSNGAAVYAVLSVLASFFAGGCVVSRCTAGESKGEAAMYGAIMWGAALALLLWVSGSVFSTGVTALAGAAPAAANVNDAAWERSARQANVTDAQITQMRSSMPTAEQARDTSARAAWWAFGALMASMLASVGGAVMSAGPRPIFGAVTFRRQVPHPMGG